MHNTQARTTFVMEQKLYCLRSWLDPRLDQCDLAFSATDGTSTRPGNCFREGAGGGERGAGRGTFDFTKIYGRSTCRLFLSAVCEGR